MPQRSPIVAWLQLLRLPNVYTAVADVTMGYAVTQFYPEWTRELAMLIASSSMLYLSAMVLNDVFDVEEDKRDQPARPIPSGRVSLKSAAALGWGLWAGGLVVAWSLSFEANDWRPGAIATLLAACIILYDGALKRSRLAPFIMGECRFLNVLLGMSLLIVPWGEGELLTALGIGVYIMGVTIFARTDARISSRRRLVSGFAILLAGIALLAAVPSQSGDRPSLEIPHLGWYLLWAALALIIGRRCLIAIFEPSPRRVQAAVRNCVHSIIALDAALCVGYVNAYWGFAVLSLLVPTMLLTLWLNAT